MFRIFGLSIAAWCCVRHSTLSYIFSCTELKLYIAVHSLYHVYNHHDNNVCANVAYDIIFFETLCYLSKLS